MRGQIYNKNSNLRYHIYKELADLEKRQEEKDKFRLNQFVAPVFSATVTAGTTYLATKFDWLPREWSFIYLFGTIVVFIAFYLCAVKVLKAHNDYKHRKVNADPELSFKEAVKRLKPKFDYEVTTLTYLSYSLVKDATKGDDSILERFDVAESVFYLNRSIKKLNDVFADHAEYKNHCTIPPARIYTVISVIAETIALLKAGKYLEQIKDELRPSITMFNDTISVINKEYGFAQKISIITGVEE